VRRFCCFRRPKTAETSHRFDLHWHNYDVEEGSYADGDEVDGVYSFTVVDPEGHRWRFDGVVALTG
jgi:hypothetical protein